MRDWGIPILFGLFLFLSGSFLGCNLGAILEETRWHKKCIDNGWMEYEVDKYGHPFLTTVPKQESNDCDK